MPIRVAIVENDTRVRACLTMLIEGSAGFQCVGTHASAEEALSRILETDPDVVLMDILLPSMSGIECVRELKAHDPGLLVLMLTAYDDDELIFAALGAGASGYLLKHTQPADLLQAITEVVQGGAPMSRSIARRLIRFFHSEHVHEGVADVLSRREREILEFLTGGYYYKEVAELLGISFETVHSHVRHIYAKLQIRPHNRAAGQRRRSH